MFKICAKLLIKTSQRCQWHRYSDLIVNIEQVSHIVLMFPLLNLSKQILVRIRQKKSVALQLIPELFNILLKLKCGCRYTDMLQAFYQYTKVSKTVIRAKVQGLGLGDYFRSLVFNLKLLFRGPFNFKISDFFYCSVWYISIKMYLIFFFLI